MKEYNLITKDQLLLAEIPKQTATYKPVSHQQLIDLSLEGIHKAGFEVARESYECIRHGQVASGTYLLKGLEDSEMQMQCLWENSYDKSMKLKFIMGAMVLVCTNGMISMRAMGNFTHKHLSDVQEISPLIIPELVKSSGEVFQGLQGERDVLKSIQISKKDQAELVGRMFIEQDFLTSAQLNIIKRELLHPTHDYRAPQTMWELYQFTTYSIGGFNSTWIADHVKAHDFFMAEAELITEAEEVMY